MIERFSGAEGMTSGAAESHRRPSSGTGTARKPIALTISVCSARHLPTWKITSSRMVEFIASRDYVVIVPDEQAAIFRSQTDARVEVQPESEYVGAYRSLLEQRLASKDADRFGWYLQQLIKLSALRSQSGDDVLLIWDSDTVPLRPLEFVKADGRLIYYAGREHHRPYFACISSLLRMDKLASHSFIAQCFPTRASWVAEFTGHIERLHGKPWYEAILDSINFDESSGFSEYETLGTFLTHTHFNEMEISRDKWLRFGNRAVGAARNIDRDIGRRLLADYAFVSFETWDEPFSETPAWAKLLLRLWLGLPETLVGGAGFVNRALARSVIVSSNF